MEASQIPSPTQPTGTKPQAGKGKKKKNNQSRDASQISVPTNPVSHQYTQTTNASQVTQESNVLGVLACDMPESTVATTLSWRERKILLASSSQAAKASKQRKGGPRESA